MLSLRRNTLVAAVFALFVLLPSAALVPTGLNLPPLDVLAPNYGGAWASTSSAVFIDLFKHSTRFESQGCSNCYTGPWGFGAKEHIAWRDDGYPSDLKPPSKPSWAKVCATARIGEKAAYYPAGPYVLLHDGVGNFSITGDATVTATQPGRLDLQLTPAAGLFVRIVDTLPADPIRNIRIVPVANLDDYEQQVYQPSFLQQLSGFNVLRFTNWQKAHWSHDAQGNLPRSWAWRNTPGNQTQLSKEGVAVEHMVQLANKVGANAWFSLPQGVDGSDAYLAGFARYVAQNLAPSLTVYLEFATEGAGWLTLAQGIHTTRLATIWRTEWAALDADTSRITVVASAPFPNVIPHIFQNFEDLSVVDAIAVSGSYGSLDSWGQAGACPYDLRSGNFAQDHAGINATEMLQILRSAVIHADVTHNKWYNRVVSKGLRYLAMRGGPDIAGQMVWGGRNNYQSLSNCKSFPCSFYAYAPLNKQVTFNSQEEKDAAMPGYQLRAQNEWALEELLLELRLKDPTIKDQVLDSLRRWETMGSGEFIVSLPNPTQCSDAPAKSLLPPKECQTASTADQANPANNPIYQAVRAYQRGEKSSLPWTSGDVPSQTPSVCNPACVWGKCHKGMCVCYNGYTGADCSNLGPKPNDCNKVFGINLEGIADWSHSWTWLDVMKHGRQWLSQSHEGGGGWGNHTGVQQDRSGWPTHLELNQVAGTLMIRDLEGHFPSGTFTVLYDGDGLLDFSLSVTGVRHVEVGQVEVTVKLGPEFNNGIFLTLQRTNPANPVRNIRVLMPNFTSDDVDASPFHPAFLSFLRGYGVIRFMDWQATNAEVLPSTWDERPKVTDRSYAANIGGVPLDTMIQLANQVGAAPWFCMPHLGDNDYIRQFAAQVKQQLRPDVNVYVEWSNEVWHTGFPGGRYAQSEGIRLNMGEEGSKWYGGADNEARLCYYSERTKQMSQTWREVFGEQADRILVVAQGQTVWPITSSKILSCRNASAHIDALAVGPYFGSFDKNRDKSLDTFMDTTLPQQLESDLALVLPHTDISRRFGKQLFTYESGQGLIGDADLPMEANRDERMGGLYTRYLEGLLAANVSLVMHYSSITAYSKYGSWGLLEWQDQDPDSSPKLKAVEAFVSSDKVGGPSCSIMPDSNSTGELDYIDHFEACGYYCTFGQGTCNVTTKLSGRDRYFGCSCKPQFSGLECSRFSCPSNCNWAGTCLDYGVCSCYPGFKGPSCGVDCGCNGHGTCAPDSNTCLCDAGYRLGPSGCEPDCACDNGAPCIGPGECGCPVPCKYGDCFQGRCWCWAGYGGSNCATANATAPNSKSPMGVNVAGIAYWMSQWVFVDAFKQSSKWWTANAPDTSKKNPFDTNDTLPLRPDGYPSSLPANKVAHKLTVRNVQLKAMPGRYVALYDGEGALDFRFDAKVVSQSKGRIVFDFTPTANMECHETGAAYCGDNGIHVWLAATNPQNPLRNLRIIPPGFEGTVDRQPFHPWFLKSLERYSVLRFMEWMDTNSEYLPPWGERTKPEHDTQARPGGVALEYIVQLSNQLGAAPWVCVHHLADDAYVTKLATFLRDNLRPDLKIYIEHSNEVWNAGFPQGKYAGKMGLELGLSADEGTARYRYHAKRSQEIFQAFTGVFGEAARASRLRYVVGTWGYVCNQGTGCAVQAMRETLSYNSMASKADLVAVAGYFDCGLGANANKDMQLSQDQMLQRCTDTLGDQRSMMQQLKSIAEEFKLPLTTYEAGPSIVEASAIHSGSVTVGAAKKYIALQRDQRFEGVYTNYLTMFDSLGLVGNNTPFMHYNSAGLPSQYGSWGLLEYTGQRPDSAPKYRAVQKLLDKKQGSLNTPGCMTPSLGYRALGDASFFGAPAVLTPARGAVWIQGYSYNVTFPRAHAPTDAVTVTLYQNTNCGSTAKVLYTWTKLTPTLQPAAAWITLTMPSTVAASGVFLQIAPSAIKNAAAVRNFTELFTLAPKYRATTGPWGSCAASCAGKKPGTVVTGKQSRTVGCIVHPMVPPTSPPPLLRPFCSAGLPWNISKAAGGDKLCTFEANGCRNYRTDNNGKWYSSFKPVQDCGAQYPPDPGAAALKAAGFKLGALVPGASASTSLCPKPLPTTTQSCTIKC